MKLKRIAFSFICCLALSACSGADSPISVGPNSNSPTVVPPNSPTSTPYKTPTVTPSIDRTYLISHMKCQSDWSMKNAEDFDGLVASCDSPYIIALNFYKPTDLTLIDKESIRRLGNVKDGYMVTDKKNYSVFVGDDKDFALALGEKVPHSMICTVTDATIDCH